MGFRSVLIRRVIVGDLLNWERNLTIFQLEPILIIISKLKIFYYLFTRDILRYFAISVCIAWSVFLGKAAQ